MRPQHPKTQWAPNIMVYVDELKTRAIAGITVLLQVQHNHNPVRQNKHKYQNQYIK